MDVPIYEYQGHYIWGHDRPDGAVAAEPAADHGGPAPGPETAMTSVEYLGSYRLTQSDDYFKLGRDSVLLARFATLRKGWSVCDLGCGVGSLLLLLSQREEELDRWASS